MKKTIKRSLITGLAALVFGCYSYKPQIIDIKEGIGYTYQISQIKGEEDLHKLAKIATQEDAWMYINNEFIDIGINELEGTVSTPFKEFISLIPKDLPPNSEIVLYHIHPIKIIGPGVYPPSAPDIIVIARLKKEFESSLELILKSKVCDGYGIWEFDVDEQFERKWNLYPGSNEDPLSQFELEKGIPIDELEKYYWHMRKTILENPRYSREEKIDKFINEADKLGIILKYLKLNEK